MTLEPRIGPNGRDDDLTRVLRDVYAPPSDGAYWSALARRIVARIEDAESDGWWQPLANWARAGVVAAGIAIVVAGVAISRSRATEARLAYETIIETPRSVPLQIATESRLVSGREATARYVISP